jgi:thiol-disulfide isomerase/thioredoxin
MDTTSLPPDDRPPVASPRRTNRGLLWASALAVVVLSIATIVAFTSGGDDGVQKLGSGTDTPAGGLDGDTDVSGQVLPDLSYTTFDGQTVDLRADGRPLVINFWQASCIPCITEMPDLERFHQADAGVDLVGLQVLENADDGQDMIAKTGVTYRVGRDPRGTAMAALGGASLPRTLVVAPDGRITWVHAGPVTTDQLQAAVAQATSG